MQDVRHPGQYQVDVPAPDHRAAGGEQQERRGRQRKPAHDRGRPTFNRRAGALATYRHHRLLGGGWSSERMAERAGDSCRATERRPFRVRGRRPLRACPLLGSRPTRE